MIRRLSWIALVFAAFGCTVPHSKQALWSPSPEPVAEHATFVQEEDSGLMLAGIIQISEPDHWAVLLERARRRFRCKRLMHAQLDYYTDHWLIVSFPISRLTLVCDPGTSTASASP